MAKSEEIPTISRCEDDGTLVELLHDPREKATTLAVRHPDETMMVESNLTLTSGELLIPYSAENNLIATRCVLLPSAIGDVRDKGDIISDITAFLRRYVALTPEFEEIAAYYALLTWVYDAFDVVPLLRFKGDFGTGKSRMLFVVGSLCYKPFFASGASTVSPIFHIQDTFQGTLILDEADFRFSDSTTELIKILNNGNMRGMPVLRTMTNRFKELNPRAFRVFGPKIVGMREPFSDQALESRFITYATSSASLPANMPLHLPAAFHDEARTLRNTLLGYRLRNRHLVAIDPNCAIEGVEPRTNQTALPLLSLVDEAEDRARISAYLKRDNDQRQDDRAETVEALVLAALIEAFRDATAPYVTVGDVTERYNRASEGDEYRELGNRAVGSVLRNRLRIFTHKTRGVFTVPITEKSKIEALAVRYGLNDRRAAVS